MKKSDLAGVVINKVNCYGEIMENNERRKLLDFIVRWVLVTFEMLASAEIWAKSPNFYKLGTSSMMKTCMFLEFLTDCFIM